MENTVRELLNKNIEERYSEGRELVQLRDIIDKLKNDDGITVLTIKAVKEFKNSYGKNYVCYLEGMDDIFTFSSTSLKKVIIDLLRVYPDYFEEGNNLMVEMELKEIMGKMSCMVIKVL